MTKINKLVLSGFKSFANKTELVFGNTVNCVLGPNGNGKCVTGDTQVSLADGSLVAIRDLIESKERITIPRVLDDGLLIDGDGTAILTLNLNTLQLEAKPIKAYVKRTSPEKLVKITTRSGRTITSTPYHPLFVLRDGHVVSVRADELTESTKIAVPRKIEVKPASKIFYELLDLIHFDDGIYVPWNEEIKVVLHKAKTGTWNELATAAGISPVVLKSFIIDKQAMNFAALVKLLRSLQLSDDNVIHLIPSVKTKTSGKLCRVPWENSPAFARLLGYLLAEGRIAPEENQIWFTNGTEEIIVDYIELFQNVFGDPVIAREYKPNAWDVIAFNKAALILLSKFGMPFIGGTAKKTVAPLFFSHSTEVEISHLLNGLYCGDGYVSKEIIEITTKSTQLCAGIQTALTRLGILFQTKDIVKIATNSGFEGTYKSVRIYGEPNIRAFAEQISLVHPEKRARIDALLGKKSNPNCDLIEANGLIHTVTRQLGVNVKKMKKTYPKLDAYCYNQCTPSRSGIQQILTGVLNSGEQSEELVQLQRLAFSNIYWDEIEALDVVSAPEKWVYDLCVDEHHNFVANNIYVHNSNILDALCFVLGRTSSKSMRAEKAANLIFDGGKKKKPADKGEVHIYFDNATKVFPLDAPEVKVSRIIKKSGQSIYKLNDKTHTRSEVLDMLSAARIDPDGYNIILQGDITRFVEMSPIERRQMVEEISGISVYEERKHKAVLELDKVEQKLNDADIILNERKTHLKELKKDRDQALKFKELKDGADSTKATYVHLQMEKRNDVREKLDKEVNGLKEKLAKIEGQVGTHKSLIQERKAGVDKINKEIEQKGEVEQVKLSKEIENMRVSLEKQKARVVMLKDSLSKIGQRRHALEKDALDIDKTMGELRDDQKKLAAQKGSLEKELADVESKISAFKKKNKIDTLGDVEKDMESVDKSVEQKQEEIQKIRQQQQELLREKDKIEFQLQTIDEQVKKVAQVEKENQKQISELRDKKERFKKITLELNACLDRDSSVSAEVSDLRQTLHSLQEEKAKLDARQASAQERIGGDIALRKIIELKKKKSGIYGTIAELGKVNKKYSLALEVAAGQRLLSIVVDDDKVASDCINYLRENKFGVATFIPLNKIQAPAVRPETKELLKRQGVHDLCVNVVTFDNRFIKAFQHVFGDTLVVDDLGVARGIGIGKARMVTLEGDLADYSGVMRGGFHHQRKIASFSDTDVEGQLSEVEEKLASSESRLDRLMREKSGFEQKIIALRMEKIDIEGDVAKLEKILHLGGDDLDATKRQKEELTERLAAVDRQLREVQDRVGDLNKGLAASKSAKEQLKLKVSQLRSPQLLAEIHAFDEARQTVKEQILGIQNEIQNFDVRVSTMLIPEKQRIEQLLKGHDKEQTSFTSELEQLKTTIDSDSTQLVVKEKSQRAFFSAYKDLFHTRDSLSVEINVADAAIEKLRDSSRKIEIEMNNQSLRLAALSSELAGLQTQMNQLKNARILKGKNEEELKAEMGKFEHMLANMSAVNMKALEIYEQVEVEYGKLVEKKETLLKEKVDVVSLMDEIESKKKDQFMRTFDELNNHFQEKFASLTTKGKAFLILENKEKPFDAGLDIRINTTGKRFMDIRSLSGGEKSMTALAFYFAVQEHEPHSFYLMDEVDAALDKHNSERLAHLIQQYGKNAQYIVISHNDSLISEADYLYGVSMDEFGTSKVVSLKV